jgi:RNA polymerase sigma-70 factor (sigma-E family)
MSGVSVSDEASSSTSTGSFEEFVVARGAVLWRSAWLLTGDRHLAEDLVQVGLAKSYKHFDRVGIEGFEAYVRRVVFTTYLAWWRRRWTGEVPTRDLPDSQARDLELGTRRDLVAALSALPKGQRAVIVCRYVEDLTERQTADLLGCSIGTVKSQASRALATLRISPSLRKDES